MFGLGWKNKLLNTLLLKVFDTRCYYDTWLESNTFEWTLELLLFGMKKRQNQNTKYQSICFSLNQLSCICVYGHVKSNVFRIILLRISFYFLGLSGFYSVHCIPHHLFHWRVQVKNERCVFIFIRIDQIAQNKYMRFVGLILSILTFIVKEWRNAYHGTQI